MLEEWWTKPFRLTPENDLVNCGFSGTRISEEKQTCLRHFIFKTFCVEFNVSRAKESNQKQTKKTKLNTNKNKTTTTTVANNNSTLARSTRLVLFLRYRACCPHLFTPGTSTPPPPARSNPSAGRKFHYVPTDSTLPKVDHWLLPMEGRKKKAKDEDDDGVG